jgi:hypothetical protein
VVIGGVVACVAGLLLFLRCWRRSSDEQSAWRESATMIPLDEETCNFHPSFGHLDL